VAAAVGLLGLPADLRADNIPQVVAPLCPASRGERVRCRATKAHSSAVRGATPAEPAFEYSADRIVETEARS
jgi:hypothetical protein